MYLQSVQEFSKMLTNISGLLDKAVLHAEAKKFDINNLLNARLAPDQFSLIRQIQICCDNVKAVAARLSGQDAPVHEDNEQTVDELKARITKVQDYVKGFKADDFTGAADRKIVLPFLPGVYMDGDQYLFEFATPNFYFHVSTAYAILRHNGVDIGKRDFIGHVDMKPMEV